MMNNTNSLYKKIAFYDCEIKNCIPDKFYDSGAKHKYKFSAGWHDKEGMGISCIAVYASWSGYHVFLESQLVEFQQLMDQADAIVGFNSVDFDDALVAANGVNVKTTYDLLCEVRIASGQPPHYIRGVTRGGYSLEQLSQANLGRGKTGIGALAPELWQDGEYKKVIDYCLNDIDLLRELYERRSHLIDPTNGEILCLRGGSKWEWRKARLKKWYEHLRTEINQSDWLIFWWAITRADISDCRILFRSPIGIGGVRHPPSFYISFQLPKIKIKISPQVYEEFEQQTGQTIEDIPF